MTSPPAPGSPQATWEQLVARELLAVQVRREARRQLKAAELSDPGIEAWGRVLAEERLDPRPPEDWLAEGLWRRGHKVVLAALFKTGKSRVVANCVAALAGEEKLLGWAPVNHGGRRVAVMNLDMEPWDFRDYLICVAPAAAEKVAVAHLRHSPMPVLSSSAAFDRVVAWLKWHQAQVLVVDTWGKLCAWNGVDPNDNAGVSELTSCLDQLMAEAGIAEALVTSHMPKAARGDPLQETALGAQALSAWPDAVWGLWQDLDGHRFLRVTGRGVDVPEHQLQLDPSTGLLTGVAGDRAAAAGADVVKKVYDLILANDLLGPARVPMRKAMVRQLAGGKFETVDAALAQLEKDGKITGGAVGPGAAADYRVKA